MRMYESFYIRNATSSKCRKNIIFYGNNRQHIIKMWSHKHQTTPSVSEQIRSILRGIVEPLTTSGAFYLLK